MSATDALQQLLVLIAQMESARQAVESARTLRKDALKAGVLTAAIQSHLDATVDRLDSLVHQVALAGSTVQAAIKPPVGRTLQLVPDEKEGA